MDPAVNELQLLYFPSKSNTSAINIKESHCESSGNENGRLYEQNTAGHKTKASLKYVKVTSDSSVGFCSVSRQRSVAGPPPHQVKPLTGPCL